MTAPSPKQKEILDYIHHCQQADGFTPSIREIARHFKVRSPGTISDHIAALRAKGLLAKESGRARSLRVVSTLRNLRKQVVDIPLLGFIPAGFADSRKQSAKGCVTIDIGTVGIKPSARTFALEVHGHSMIGKHILDGDMVIVEHGQTPRNGDTVAALIDGESTLKTFVADRTKPHLKAENPKYPKLIPATELVIQGVVVALVRKQQMSHAAAQGHCSSRRGRVLCLKAHL